METKKFQYQVDGQDFVVIDSDHMKIVRSEKYNYNFYKHNGLFVRWGRSFNEDPDFSPIGPEIWDCEVTTSCSGVSNEGVCRFCYKANTPIGEHLSFRNFKIMIDKFPKTLTQVAFGADAKAESNPELFDMMEYCRQIGIIPNITVADISDDIADNLASVCGAVAVSRYANKDICYNSVRKLTDRGMQQVNIHCMLSEQTFEQCMETASDVLSDTRLSGLNAIVFLGLKKKGRAINGFDIISYKKFRELFLWCLNNKVSVGFDSCSAPKFMKLIMEENTIEETLRQQYMQCCEPCESGLFSFYTAVNGCYYPCSFTENEKGWEDGLSLLECNDFLQDIWYHPKNIEWRKRLIESGDTNICRQCLTFPEINS